MPALVSAATRIWELNTYWPVGSQCGVWDAKIRGVDIWECIRPHTASHGSGPPNPRYWRYVTRR
ncbi:hypothetical protein PHLGIDRAFT_73645 [Phlebiopsis gigantea 11061_1 CR5-6]|uniref:Uncharacterized protein n=1 Tax=Phlebiopsis gigantea (strain 11061_1 CR5-6) TaxID=745531 RepID=A0A0C3RWA9_PHLG1|nr:hypothetical protein PHLGIDRAFT_73645 [Phlebiopsis gigantea 11061_1 CR5-6]